MTSAISAHFLLPQFHTNLLHFNFHFHSHFPGLYAAIAAAAVAAGHTLQDLALLVIGQPLSPYALVCTQALLACAVSLPVSYRLHKERGMLARKINVSLLSLCLLMTAMQPSDSISLTDQQQQHARRLARWPMTWYWCALGLAALPILAHAFLLWPVNSSLASRVVASLTTALGLALWLAGGLLAHRPAVTLLASLAAAVALWALFITFLVWPAHVQPHVL